MTQNEDAIIEQALSILELRLKSRAVFSDPDEVKSFLRLQSRGLAEETLAVMYLDGEGRLIEYERQSAVDPPKIARDALIKNAAGVIIHHNNSDRSCWPSLIAWDETIQIQDALNAVGLSVIDHVVTSEESLFSMAESKHY